MASQVNPLAAGNVTDDPRFNERFGLVLGPAALSMYTGVGVPANTFGRQGEAYLRQDGGAGTTLYQFRAGAWAATGA